MSRPKFCPNCGQALLDSYSGAQPFEHEGDGGWDCYCAACKWSGDILPDAEAQK